MRSNLAIDFVASAAKSLFRLTILVPGPSLPFSFANDIELKFGPTDGEGSGGLIRAFRSVSQRALNSNLVIFECEETVGSVWR
jgi:hypothetical protein